MMNKILDDNGLQYLLSLMKDKLYDKQEIDELLDKVASIDIVIQGNAQVNNTDIRYRQPYSGTISPLPGYAIVDVEVLMGEDDITSTSYNNGSITISKVTDIVTVNVQTSEIIIFKDSTVKEICVETWGGNYANGEITKLEVSSITSLNDAFYGNTTIKYFPELKYFTGLTGSWLWHPTTINTVNDYRGQFTGCTALEEIEFPPINLNVISGSFFNCSSLKEIDLSPVSITATTSADRRFSIVFRGCSSLEKLILPQSWASSFSNFYQPFNGCTSLKYIDFGNANFSALSSVSSTRENEGFNPCSKLTTIKNGLYNLKGNLRLVKNPLTRESVLEIIDNLYDYRDNGDSSTTKTITLKATTYDTLTAEDIALAANKGWSIVSA